MQSSKNTTWRKMSWWVVFVVLSCLFFVGCSLKSLFLYLIVVGTSLGFTHLFITNKWGLDGLFEEFFKAVELFGFGAPHRLENRIAYSSFYTNGGFNRLEEIPKPLEEGLKKLIENIIRDFIRTWYENVGEGEHFISDTRESLEMLCLEGYKRASQTDSHYLIEQVIVVFHGHLERFNKAMAIVKAKDPKLRLNISSSQLLCQTYESQLSCEPPPLSSPAAELSYLRNVIDSLLAAMIPKDTFSCDTGRFILREILTVQILEPLVQLLTDPDWICQAVIDILTEEENGKIHNSEVRNEDNGFLTGDLCDSVSIADKSLVVDGMHLSLLNENTTAVLAPKTTSTEEMSRKESRDSKDSIEDVGERIEITSPGASVDSPDFRWSVTSQREPPIGESQHDNGESFLVISVEESRENTEASQSQSGNNWSTEVAPPSSVENLASCSLSSSWGICPSSQDETFRTKSFEEMKGQPSGMESNGDVGGKLQSLKEMTCCHSFEKSDEAYRPWSLVAQKGSSDEGSDVADDVLCPRFRTRSFSLPGSNEVSVTDTPDVHSLHREISRSASVPCKLSSVGFSSQDMEEFYTPSSPRKIHGTQFYGGSFCSSSDSFKSVSDDEDILDSYIERGEEALEHCDNFDSYTVESQGTGYEKSSRGKITKQASFEEPQEKCTSDLSTEEFSGSRDGFSLFSKDKFRTEKLALQSKNDSSELDDIKESSWDGVDQENLTKHSSSYQKRLRFGFGTQGSEPSLGDAFLTAGKKFVSNFKPPFKFDSLSSSSTKSSETSGSESLDHPAENQPRIPPKGMSLDVGRARAATYTSCGARRLSRSDAVIEESMDSDTGTCYGSPREEYVQEVMGVSKRGGAADSSSIMSVKRMHPSQLISIPATVVALETTWEPGRNKYTLYKIEYDVRIWHEVYSAALKQAKNEAKKERMKRRLYGNPTENEQDDEELSLDRIKKNISLKRFINRRYREFMELHNRLTGGELCEHMKDILKPNRKYNLPFGRLDPHVVEGRRELLENYLRSLISKPHLRNSEDLKQFLGVTEGEQISFIKPSVAQMMSQSVHVPRVDKMLSRQMTKVIDSIKTAFDSVEGEENTSEEYSAVADYKAVVPWRLAGQDVPNKSPEVDFNQENYFAMHCYSAFIVDQEEFAPPTPPSPMSSFSEEKQEILDEQDAGRLWGRRLKNKVMPFEPDEEGVGWDAGQRACQPLGPRTAGDGSDNPGEPAVASSNNKLLANQVRSTPVFQAGTETRERSGAIFKRYLDVQSSSSQAHNRPLGNSLSYPVPKSKSMEGIATAGLTSKFQFRPQKILEAAKRIGQGSKSGSMESLDVLPTDKGKKQGNVKKLLKESSIPVVGGNPEKQKADPISMKRDSPVTQPLKPDEPCTVSQMDQPSNLDNRALTEGASSGSDLQCPLSDAILALLCELLKDRGSWLTVDRVQQGFSGTLGGLLEWCVQSGIDDITSDDSWALYLDKLNEVIWPDGKLAEDAKKPKSEIEKSRTRKDAVQALMDAFPGFIRLLIGPRVYHQTAVNVIDSLQYPQLNKILFYTLLELLFSEFVPEIQETLQFYRRVTAQN